MRLLAADPGQLAQVQLAPGHLGEGVRPAFARTAPVVRRRRRHQCVQRRLQGRPVVGPELAVEHEHAAKGLAQVQEATLVLLVGILEHAVGLDAVAKVDDATLEHHRVFLPSQLDQDRFGRPLELVAQALGSARDQGRVLVADVAFRQRLARQLQRLQLPRHLDSL